MHQSIGLATYLVRDYDIAISWFKTALGFELVEDTPLAPDKRWVVMRPPGSSSAGAALLLARAADQAQCATVGNQAGGRVMWFLTTNDFDRYHARMQAAGVQFLEPPRDEDYGKVAVFVDLYDTRWDLIQPRQA